MVYKYNLTIDELEEWMNNVTINPRTKRKIKLDLDNKLKIIVNKYIKINIDILSDTNFKKKFLLYHPDSCKRTINYNGKNIIGIGRFIEDKSPFITDDNIIKCANQLYSVIGKEGIVF